MYRAIVVDDEEMIRNGMSRQIETMGLSIKVVAKAKDGVEALEQFHTYTPDLLLMDINIPHIDGLECIRRIRKMNQTCVIIIVSGYDEFEYARQAIIHNVDFYLLKPVEDDEFKAIIEQAIAKYNDRIERQNIISRFAEPKQKPKSSVIEFINTHYTQKELSSEILEKEFNLSRTALFKLMKELTGMSFVEYLTMLRINYSIRLLKEDKTIGEISSLSGYADQYYFSRVFKKKTGFTPTEYRENMERNR
ncbi:MAG: response regulator [Lachnospiraceae bacterium]|jgi:two-component system response regulator YesN|nr:response regulator [Lachnospiraceae bacterium]